MPKKLKYDLPPLNKGEKTIGKRLAQFRKEKALTQTQLAQKIGITQSLVSDYEIGRIHMSDVMLIRFALALNKSADEILGLKQEKFSDKPLSLRFMKRFKDLEKLPEQKQKAILASLDMMIDSAQKDKKKRVINK